MVVAETSEAELRQRWESKREQIRVMSNNIQRLRAATTKDLKSDNEKEALTALVIKIMDITGERPGNKESAEGERSIKDSEGHYGVTGFRKDHISIEGNTVYLDYTGKSGKEHEKKFTNEAVAQALKKAIKNSPTKDVFVTSEGFEIKPDRILRYLSSFDVRSKDIRGWKCNKMVTDKLRDILSNDMDGIHKDTPEFAKRRKKVFLTVLKDVARHIGHLPGTLRSHYLLPEVEQEFLNKGKVVDITDTFEFGGSINGKARSRVFRMLFGH